MNEVPFIVRAVCRVVAVEAFPLTAPVKFATILFEASVIDVLVYPDGTLPTVLGATNDHPVEPNN